jgi:hypothetical protein
MSRQRDIFPLPRIEAEECPLGSRRRRANLLIDCLNEMQGSATSCSAPIAVQQRAHAAILKQVARAVPLAPHSFGRASAETLMCCRLSYLSEEQADSPVVPYDSARLSIPFVGHSAACAADVLDPAGRVVLEGFNKHMLLAPDAWSRVVHEGESIIPYMDPVLKHSPVQHALFVKKLWDAGMIDFTDSPLDVVTPFCVSKKYGRQRLVLDCRCVNRRFKPSPPMEIPLRRYLGAA